MSTRVVVFLDWQNVYNGARAAFCSPHAPYWKGQVDPVALAQHLAADSPFDRKLHQVRIYRGQPDATLDPKGYIASSHQAAAWQQSPLVELNDANSPLPAGLASAEPHRRASQEKGIDVALAIDFS